MEQGLADIMRRGGIFRDIKGAAPAEALTSFIGSLPPGPVPADVLLKAVLEREALMPTGICKGIALPHPRNPLITSESDQFVALAYLEHPVDWNSLDGEKVDTLLLIVSASAKQHLHILSAINFLCRQDDFYALLKNRAGLDELLDCVRETEKRWK